MNYYEIFKYSLFHTFLLFLLDPSVKSHFKSVYLSGRFNSITLPAVFYTGFKTLSRNEFLVNAHPIVLECGFRLHDFGFWNLDVVQDSIAGLGMFSLPLIVYDNAIVVLGCM